MRLYKELDPDLLYGEQVTAMVATAEDGHMEAVELTTGKGPNSEMLANSSKSTAFLHAIPSGHLAIIKVLLKKNAHLDVRRTVRFTDLMVASLNGHAEIVKLLAASGAKMDLKSNDGSTALIFASQNGNIEIVKLLLEKGADMDIQRADGCSAVMVAAKNGHSEVVKLLLEKGANPDLKDHKGKTFMDYTGNSDIKNISGKSGDLM